MGRCKFKGFKGRRGNEWGKHQVSRGGGGGGRDEKSQQKCFKLVTMKYIDNSKYCLQIHFTIIYNTESTETSVYTTCRYATAGGGLVV